MFTKTELANLTALVRKHSDKKDMTDQHIKQMLEKMQAHVVNEIIPAHVSAQYAKR
jgi:phage shock protein A